MVKESILPTVKKISNAERHATYMREWRAKNVDHARELDRESYKRCAVRRRAYAATYRRLNSTRKRFYDQTRRQARKDYRNGLRIRLVLLLGSKCVKCGYTDLRALQIDHINGGGTTDRKRFTNNIMFHRYYLRNREEASHELQVLCANCNTIKRLVKKEYSLARYASGIMKNMKIYDSLTKIG